MPRISCIERTVKRTAKRDRFDCDTWSQPIGNRTQSTTGTADPVHYCTNGVNQYEATAAAPGCATPTESFGHDADGNLAYDGSLLYEWDGENRLRAAYVANPTTTDDKKVVFTYDIPALDTPRTHSRSLAATPRGESRVQPAGAQGVFLLVNGPLATDH